MVSSAWASGFLAVAIVGLALGATSAAGQDIAMVYDVSGDVVRSSPTGGPTPLGVGDRVAEGDRLEIRGGGYVRLIFTEGGISRMVRTSQTIHADDLPPRGELGDRFDRAFQTLAAPRPPTSNARGVLRPAPGQPVPEYPSGGVSVLLTEPEFRWNVPEEVGEIVFRLRAVGEDEWLEIEATGRTSLALPEGHTLERGKTFEWAVNTVDHWQAPVPASFTVLSEEDRQAIGTLEKRLQAEGHDPHAGGALLMGILYADLGLGKELMALLAGIEEHHAGRLGQYFYELRSRAHALLGNREAAIADARRARAGPP